MTNRLLRRYKRTPEWKHNDLLKNDNRNSEILNPNNQHSANRMVFIRKITWQLSLIVSQKKA